MNATARRVVQRPHNRHDLRALGVNVNCKLYRLRLYLQLDRQLYTASPFSYYTYRAEAGPRTLQYLKHESASISARRRFTWFTYCTRDVTGPRTLQYYEHHKYEYLKDCKQQNSIEHVGIFREPGQKTHQYSKQRDENFTTIYSNWKITIGPYGNKREELAVLMHYSWDVKVQKMLQMARLVANYTQYIVQTQRERWERC